MTSWTDDERMITTEVTLSRWERWRLALFGGRLFVSVGVRGLPGVKWKPWLMASWMDTGTGIHRFRTPPVPRFYHDA